MVNITCPKCKKQWTVDMDYSEKEIIRPCEKCWLEMVVPEHQKENLKKEQEKNLMKIRNKIARIIQNNGNAKSLYEALEEIGYVDSFGFGESYRTYPAMMRVINAVDHLIYELIGMGNPFQEPFVEKEDIKAFLNSFQKGE